MTSSHDMILSFVQRIEAENQEIADRNENKKAIYAEVKSAGFDAKALKVVIQRRAKDPDELSELESLVQTYEAALDSKANQEHARPQAQAA